MSEFHLTIRTPDKDLFSGKVSALSFNTETGRVQILAHHANFTTTLLFSSVKVEDPVDNRDQTFLARNGFFHFDHKKNEALLLCLYCEEQSQVSYQSTEEYLHFLKTELEKGDLSDFQVLYLKGEKLAVEKQIKALK